MVLVGHSKRFLHLATGAPGSTYGGRLLRQTSLYRDIANGGGISTKFVSLGDSGLIPLVTIGDFAFPCFYSRRKGTLFQ